MSDIKTTVARLRELLASATPGPWLARVDADFISILVVESRNALPVVLDALEEAWGEIARLRSIVPQCSRGPKACDAEIARLTAERDEARKQLAEIEADVIYVAEAYWGRYWDE